MEKKTVAIGIIFLLFSTSIISSSAQNTEKSRLSISRGKWWYVGGSGPGNYTRIQDAINNASDGETVFVYPGRYMETIIIHTSIELFGRDAAITIIDGAGRSSGVLIEKEKVIVHGFTVTNSSVGVKIRTNYVTIANNTICFNYEDGIGIVGDDSQSGDYSVIQSNKIFNNTGGIQLVGAEYNQIIYNNISCNTNGVYFGVGTPFPNKNNDISHNIFMNKKKDVALLYAGDTVIQGNIFRNAFSMYSVGISLGNNVDEYMTYSNNNVIIGNVFLKKEYGIQAWDNDLDSAKGTIVMANNFIENTRDVSIIAQWDDHTTLMGNYWGTTVLGVKFIKGQIGIPLLFIPYYRWVSWLYIDWSPAKKPYDIPMPEVPE